MERKIDMIGSEMEVAGLPSDFVRRVLELARESEGVEDLVHLWSEAPNPQEREEVENALQEALDDNEPPPPNYRVDSVEDAERLLRERRLQKTHLRALVETHGGVTEVARRADMPQPSLSRLLNSMSEPRPATLRRLAAAMGLPVADLTPKERVAKRGWSDDRRRFLARSQEALAA